jgi:hypothetical protein
MLLLVPLTCLVPGFAIGDPDKEIGYSLEAIGSLLGR